MKNDFEIRGDTTAILLRRRDGSTIETLIDTDDLNLISRADFWKAQTSARFDGIYVNGKINGKFIQLHRFLIGDVPGFVIDHVNHNPLDNRRTNLRAVSQTLNMMNRKGAQSNSKSGIRGVYWIKRKQRWIARVKLCGKIIHLGTFTDKELAQQTVEAKRAEIMAELLKDERHVA